MTIKEIIANMTKSRNTYQKEVQEIKNYLNSGIPISEDDKKYLNLRISSLYFSVKRLQKEIVKLDLLNKFQNSVGRQ